MTDSPYMSIFAVMWVSAAVILILWFFWRDRKEQKQLEQRWQEREERKREAERQRQQHLKERHALILRTREQRYQLEERALVLLDKLQKEGRLCISDDEYGLLSDAVCVEYENLGVDIMYHENLYRGLSEEADEAIQEIDDEEIMRAQRMGEKGMWSQEGSLNIRNL